MVMTYKKGADAAMDRDHADGVWFGNIRVGREFIFVKQFLRTMCVRADEVARAWRRVEQVEARTGCCSNDFSQHYLVMVLKDGSEVKWKIGEALYRHEPEALMEEIVKRWNWVEIGKVG